MKILLLILAVYSSTACASKTSLSSQPLVISSAITENDRMPFIERDPGLALNVDYEDVKQLRVQIARIIKRPLKFFTGWDKDGEAHVTTITPPEYNLQLKPYLAPETINRIAQNYDIQASDVRVLGIGSGKKKFGSETGETFFIIVESRRLRQIRAAIYREYLRRGGPVSGPKAFNPNRFYPHITIGFTHSDIHESDGLLKDVRHSFDRRFKLKVVR